jgi:import inner membrane translocase subunit TIM50
MGDQNLVQEACQALDPRYEMIIGRFGRESTLLKDGKYIKDLSYLNRPIKDIVYIDFTDDPVEFHKENCIILPKFEGDKSDRSLIDLLPFLERKLNFIWSLISFILF